MTTQPFMPNVSTDFLKGGGEMGARMRGFDWSASTSLGDPAEPGRRA